MDQSVPVWKYTDPRFDINKRADIVILRPSLVGHGHMNAGTAHVDTKEGWWIITDFPDHPSIEEWDPDWCWTFAPAKRV